jgi:Xaa-Pro aminopeptidase
MEVHDIVCQAQLAALKLCKPGAKIGDIDAAARDFISTRGFGDKFNHGLGHGIGLEVHELPVIKNITPYNTVKLEKGMAITIEPGIYLPGIGGVRIEDTVVITDDGYENLTQRETSHRGHDA